MKYFIEIINMKDGSNVSTIVLERDDFDEMKTMVNLISVEFKCNPDYYIKEELHVLMYDNEAKPKPHMFHYISATHPNVSLPSKPL